ncbi:hypothetical protein [Bdellovibrio reynosensis]|uniref:Outer membrane protein beta-barrel domain-containing protein n=1 Tax=Bdellovibrio reynosensis TaxID=2835041 RepID=A0ABY4C5M2_9BACT|nr:hypothetical protein [Bdellovibrio reynosensis]UOF00183.1 hypothetical protein MNR06_10765 [Bdellovibrio reynosensis]
MMDDVAVIPNNKLIKVGELVVVVRPSEDNIEVIARGSVENIQNNELLILLDGASVTKFPKAKDLVVSLAKLNPQVFDEPPPDKSPEIREDVPDPYEPGYMVLDFGPYQGKFESQSPNSANQYKIFNNDFVSTHFLWYFDFVWRYGIEYEAAGGNVPVKSYNRVSKATSYKESSLAIHYRFLPIWKELRPTLKLISKNSTFTTENDDEYVMSSSASGMGFGTNFHYLFNDNLFKSIQRFDWSLNKTYFELAYFPSYTVKDTGVTRGDSGSGTALEMKAGVIFLFHLRFIPFFKRWSLDLSTGVNQSQFSFSGPTVDPVDGFTQIPEGQTYNETQNFIKLTLGLRMDDYIGKALKPR